MFERGPIFNMKKSFELRCFIIFCKKSPALYDTASCWCCKATYSYLLCQYIVLICNAPVALPSGPGFPVGMCVYSFLLPLGCDPLLPSARIILFSGSSSFRRKNSIFLRSMTVLMTRNTTTITTTSEMTMMKPVVAGDRGSSGDGSGVVKEAPVIENTWM